MLNTVTKAFYFFIVTYCYNLQAAYNPDAVFWATVQAGQNSQYARDVRINSAVVNDQISLESLSRTFQLEYNNLNQRLGDFMTTFHLIIEQVAHPETLRDINERAEELQRLKNELLNELIHLNAYRREIHAWRLSVNQQLTDINKKLASLKNQEGRLHLLEDRYTLLKFDVNLVNLENVKHDINLFSDSIANIFTNIQKIQTNIENKMINYEKSFNIELKQELRKQLNLIYENEAFLKTMLQLFKEEQEVRIKSLERNIEFLQRGNTNYLKIMGIGLAVLFVCVIWQQYQIYCLTHCR